MVRRAAGAVVVHPGGGLLVTATKRDMGKRRKEKQRAIPDPSVPPAPPKGKKGDAAKTSVPRTKEALRAGRKVSG
jgi:hypothetical protein